MNVIKTFLKEGHRVYAIAPRDAYSDKITAIGASYIPVHLENYSNSVWSDFKTFYQLTRIYKQYSLDIIFHYTIKPNIYGCLAAKFLNIDCFAIVTGLGKTFRFSKLAQSMVNKVYQYSLSSCREVWFLNEENRHAFIQKGLVNTSKTRLLPSEGIDLEKFKSRQSHVAGKITRFLFAGRLLKEKGILIFLNAAIQIRKEFPRTKFEIVGFTDPKNPDSIRQSDLEFWQDQGWVNYLGSFEDIRPYIDRSDCIVFPSFYEEGISRILLEAASMEKPIITTDNVGCRDVVKDGYNGLLMKEINFQSLIVCMQEFMNLKPKAKKKMGLNGRSFVAAHYSDQLVMKNYLKSIDPGYTSEDQKSFRNTIAGNDIALHPDDKNSVF